MRRRAWCVVFTLACACPAPAAADWLLSPYVGIRFGADTTYFVGSLGAQRNDKLTFGSSWGFLSDGVLGVEADLAFIPGFFDSGNVADKSRVTTLMGNVIAAVPIGLTQYGLRPYATGGAGLIHARSQAGPFLPTTIRSDLWGVNVGGGAIGPLGDRTSLRFDVRYVRNISTQGRAPTLSNAAERISFWRATVGLTFRY